MDPCTHVYIVEYDGGIKGLVRPMFEISRYDPTLFLI